MGYSYESVDFDNDPRLNIINVAYLCGIRDLIPEGFRYTSVCPFCGAKPGHFYLTPEDPHSGYKNVYKCVKCGESGAQVKLYYKLHNCSSTKQAYKEIMGFDIKSEVTDFIKKAKELKKVVNTQSQIASLVIRNEIYRILIENLNISQKHTINLLKRGLTKEQIELKGFRTLPENHNIKKEICKKIIKKGFCLKGVPGFYTDYQKEWTFWTPKEGGFLVPVIDYRDMLQGFQVRKDVASKKKYPWFSSSYMENGCKIGGYTHVHWNSAHTADKVVITEGPLKATIASILSDTTFVAVPGTGSFNYIISTLQDMNAADNLITAYDMDKTKNPYVMNHLKKLHQHLKNNGYNNVADSNWNPEYKGIDDYLFYVKKQQYFDLSI